MENVIKLRNLSTEFKVGKKYIKIVKNVSLDVKRGKILSIVGESGCGKSVTVNSMVKLLPKSAKISSGSSEFFKEDGNTVDIIKEKAYGKKMRTIRGKEIGSDLPRPNAIPKPSLYCW